MHQISGVYFDKPSVFVTTACESREWSIVFVEFVPYGVSLNRKYPYNVLVLLEALVLATLNV